MSCPLWVLLVKKSQTAAERLDVARKRLHDTIGMGSRIEYLALSRETDLAWNELGQALSMLDHHIRRHPCGQHQEALAAWSISSLGYDSIVEEV